MKKRIALVLSFVFVFVLAGCSTVATKKGLLLNDGKVEKISVTSSPEGYDYAFSGKDAQAIIDYLSELNLIADFSENPDEYVGMAWVISIEYESGETEIVCHSANKFIRTVNGPWYKMTYEEASRFDALLNELGD